MPDDMDSMLQGEGEQTSSAAPAENKTQVSDSGNPIEGAEQLSPEEAEWRSLKGDSRDRFREIVREKNKWKELASQTQYPPPPPPPAYSQPDDVQSAVKKLDEVGIATKDFVSSEVQKSLGNLKWSFELEKLEGKFDGSDGKPRFDREEYFDYIGRHPEYRNYLPEDVYEKMFKEELQDYSVKPQPVRTKTLKPSKTSVGEEPMTPELIEQRMKEPDGREWYEKNVDKINRVLGAS